MGKALSTIRHPFRNYNLEDRVHRVISRDKPTPAPKFKSDLLDYEQILKNHPEVVENSLKKHEELNKYLKDVYVTSEDPAPIQYITRNAQETSNRPLPMNRGIVPDYEMGYKETDKMPIGKASLKTIMRFIGMYQNNPKFNNVQKIAAEYELDENYVSNILKHVRLFEVYIPDDRNTKANFAGPSIPKAIVTKIPRPQLPSGNKNDDT